MSRITSPARHRADVAGNIALQGLAHTAKLQAKNVGRPVAVVAVTSGLAFTAMGTANAGSYTAPAASAAVQGGTHTVVAGDTLGSISAIHGVSLNALLAVNGLSVASVIYPGDSIAIPAAGAAVAAPVQTVAAPAAAAPVQTVTVAPVAPAQYAASVAPVQYAAAVAPAAAVSTAPGSGVYLANATIAPIAAPAAAPSSNVAGILVSSAYGQLNAGAIQDCTVLVERALRAAGISVGDLGPSQFFQFGSVVSTPAPGDIVITAGHVAIYVGGGQVISSGMNGANLTMKHPLSDLPGASFVRVG